MANTKLNTLTLEPTHENIVFAANQLKKGSIGAIPTETVYGLAGNAFDSSVCTQIFEAKERPTFDPLIVHIACLPQKSPWQSLTEQNWIDWKNLRPLAIERIRKLVEAYWPGPLTLILPKTGQIPDLVTSALPNVAVRMPKHEVTQALLGQLDFPLAAPSANRFGRVSPTKSQHVLEELEGKIPWILDGGPCEVGIESTVVWVLSDGAVSVLRPGKITKSEIKRTTDVSILNAIEPALSATPNAPGMLESHYAPKTQSLILPLWEHAEWNHSIGTFQNWMNRFGRHEKIGILAKTKFSAHFFENALMPLLEVPSFKVFSLCAGEAWNASEAARNVFSKLRDLDAYRADQIWIEPVTQGLERESTGLAHAIQDRLNKACGSTRALLAKSKAPWI